MTARTGTTHGQPCQRGDARAEPAQRRRRPRRGWRTALLAALVAVTTGSATAETLRLDADGAVRLALEASHLAAAAEQRLVGARSSVAAADAGRMPTISAGATVEERSSVPELRLAPDPSSPPMTIFPDIRTAYDLSLRLEQTLYAGGAIGAAREAARRGLEASEAERRTTVAAVELEARLAYWRTAAALAAVTSAESAERRAGRLVADARSLRKAGLAVDADVLGAEARHAAARLAVIEARSASDAALAGLRSLVGSPPGATLDLSDAMPATLPEPPLPLARLLESARSRRPELAALAARLEALQARVRVARSGDRPALGAGASWRLARPNLRELPLRDRWADSWSVVLSARWSLSDGGRRDAEAAALDANRLAAAEELAESGRRIALEVETSRLRLVSALAAVAAADASRGAAAARHRAVEERYRAGLATISEVLEAEAELSATETHQVAARTGAWVAAARLRRAAGR